jgi:hypothetical protein
MDVVTNVSGIAGSNSGLVGESNALLRGKTDGFQWQSGWPVVLTILVILITYDQGMLVAAENKLHN